MQTDNSSDGVSPAKADVFVSYKSENRAAVEPLVRALESEGFTVWWDRTLVPGEEFSKVIRDALDAASCVVVAWSKLSVESPWVQDEAGVGRDRRILVPISLDGSTPPLGFRQLHTADLSDWNGKAGDPRIKRLLEGVRRLVSRPPGSAITGMAAKLVPPRRRAWWIAAAALAAAIIVGVVAYVAIPPLQLKPIGGGSGTPPPSADAIPNFSDCPIGCPRLIVVATGSFDMGSPDSEPQRGNDEGPVRKVTIPKIFAAGQFPVTFEEWKFCRTQGGCTDLVPSTNNWGEGRHPVINVSWQDAQVYVAWLSKTTGKKYRLLTEAEREYITRAGTTTPFWWGNDITTDQANYDGTQQYIQKPTGLYRKQTVTVDTFPYNPWGFYQVSGNTWDWVEDCYHDSYDNAPTDSSAWLTGDCAHRVLRGGSWGSQPRNVRSAARWKLPIATREPYYGFRVARECDADCDF